MIHMHASLIHCKWMYIRPGITEFRELITIIDDKPKINHSLRLHEEMPLHNFDMVTALMALDFAASSNGSD